jgi:Lon protease-like protein
MKRALPARPSLEHLKSQAKDLLDAFQRGDDGAHERVRQALPAANGVSGEGIATLSFALHDAQSVIAREYGFKSFAELKAAVERALLPPESVRELMQRQMSTPLPEEVLRAVQAARTAAAPALSTLPLQLPIVALRNAVLMVGAVAPLAIARAASLRAIEAALAADGWLGIFTQREVELEAPALSDLHGVGCAVKVMTTLPGEQGLWLIVRAAQWIKLETLSSEGPYLVGVTARFEVENEADAEVARLEQTLRERARGLAAGLPDAPAMLRLIDSLGPRELADATVANLPASVEEKARYAGEPSLRARLEQALALTERAA